MIIPDYRIEPADFHADNDDLHRVPGAEYLA